MFTSQQIDAYLLEINRILLFGLSSAKHSNKTFNALHQSLTLSFYVVQIKFLQTTM